MMVSNFIFVIMPVDDTFMGVNRFGMVVNKKGLEVNPRKVGKFYQKGFQKGLGLWGWGLESSLPKVGR